MSCYHCLCRPHAHSPSPSGSLGDLVQAVFAVGFEAEEPRRERHLVWVGITWEDFVINYPESNSLTKNFQVSTFDSIQQMMFIDVCNDDGDEDEDDDMSINSENDN